MESKKRHRKHIHCEFTHQTGVMKASDVEWMIGERKKCSSDTAICISQNPKKCAEHSCQNNAAWDHITTVYYSRDRSDANTLVEQLAKQQWDTISCLHGLDDVCSEGYFVCLLSQE